MADCLFLVICLLLEFFGLGLLMWAGPFGMGYVRPTKWILTTHVVMSFHPSWTFIISKYFGFS